VAIGVATTLVSVITGVQFFRLLTPGALFANLALIPAAMLVTLGGFASIVCGLAGWTGGAVLGNHASALVLLGVEWTVRLSVQVKGAFVPAHFTAPWMGGVAFAALMAALLAGYGAGWKKERGGWWPPFAVAALALILGVKFG
jgi:competence protein ComEC